MFDAFNSIQVHILFACGFESIFLALFTAAMNFHYAKKKRALIKIELGVALLLLADACCYIYRGEVSQVGFWMVRIANFLTYALVLGNQYFLNEYVTVLFMSTGRYKKLPKRLLVGFILPSIGLTLVVISAFTGWYYYFDANNVYQRGPLFYLSFLFPFIALAFMLSFVIEQRKVVGKGIFFSLMLYVLLPVIAMVVQTYFHGLSLMNLSTWVAAMALFWSTLVDQNKELSKAANTEIFTGLPNTYGFMYEVDQIISRKDITQYCGYYFDIVRMNQFNNKYGKPNGDEIIRKYAKALADQIEKDEIVGRLGGNFFVALIKKYNTEKFLNLLKDVPVKFQFEGHEEIAHVAAVAGVYEINAKNIAAGQILGNCSNAIGYAKNVVHKPYVFHDEILEKELERIQKIEENSRKAIKNNEFEPFYQPKVDTVTNCLCGAEALARWKKNGKYVPPIDFVPVMERNGSVCDLDFYILNRVCSDIKGWIEAGLDPIPVSVNFSRKNLGNPILAEAIWNVVKSYGIPESLIQVEVTETIDEYPLSYLIGVVEALHRYGISVAIDDFGTGSSSLSLLKETEFDVLKIDKLFVDYKNAKEKNILEDIISLAHDIGIEVLAEGVEQPVQVSELKEMGCFKIQGFVFDRPLPKDEFEKRISNKEYTL